MQILLIFHKLSLCYEHERCLKSKKSVPKSMVMISFFLGGHFQNGCRILPIFKCFFDFNEIWFTWETWHPELIGDGEIFFRAAIFKMAANFSPIFLNFSDFNEIWYICVTWNSEVNGDEKNQIRTFSAFCKSWKILLNLLQ